MVKTALTLAEVSYVKGYHKLIMSFIIIIYPFNVRCKVLNANLGLQSRAPVDRYS